MTNLRGWAIAFLSAMAFLTPTPATAATDVVAWTDVPAMTGSGKPATAEEIRREGEQWGKIIREQNIKAE